MMKRTGPAAVLVTLLWGCSEDQPPSAPSPSTVVEAAVEGPQGLIEEPRIGEYNVPAPNPTNRAAATAAQPRPELHV